MADNYVIKDGNGVLQTMGAKSIGSVLYPWHMLSFFVNGANVAANADSNGNLGVNVNSSNLPSGAATSANQSTQITAEQAIQAANGAPGDGIWGGSGSASQIALLKYIGTKDEAIRALLAGGITVTLGGASQVTLSASNVSLNSGTNNIGKVTQQVGGVDVSNGNPVPVSIPGGATLSGTVSLGAGEAVAGHFGGMQVNPTSALTRPNNTTAYPANGLVASSATAGSIVVPSVSCARIAAGSFTVERALLRSNMTATQLANVSARVRLWRAAPTYTNGDGGAYAVATGAAQYLGSMTGVFENFGDGSVAQMQVDFGPEINVALASGQSIFWDLQTLTAFTPLANATFTLVPEVKQD